MINKSSVTNLFSPKKIVSCKLLGITSQCVDTKLNPFLNLQRDIYANVYSFYVTYEDGESKTVQVHNKGEVDYYMQYVEKDETKKNEPEPQDDTSDVLDQLSKLNSLHKDGIIPDDMFEEKKNALLEKLSKPQANEANENAEKIEIVGHIGKCEMCDAENVNVTKVKIVDEMGIRYREVCNSCFEKYNCIPESEPDIEPVTHDEIVPIENSGKENIQVKKCEMCDKESIELINVKIIDNMGTRYRKVCSSCYEKYNCIPE